MNRKKTAKPLMSELLKDTRRYIEQAEQTDVEPLRQFLFNEPERPLIAMGHGGSYPPAAYAALLYGTNCGLGRAITPYQANSLSDDTLRNAKLLLISKSLKKSGCGIHRQKNDSCKPRLQLCLHHAARRERQYETFQESMSHWSCQPCVRPPRWIHQCERHHRILFLII